MMFVVVFLILTTLVSPAILEPSRRLTVDYRGSVFSSPIKPAIETARHPSSAEQIPSNQQPIFLPRFGAADDSSGMSNIYFPNPKQSSGNEDIVTSETATVTSTLSDLNQKSFRQMTSPGCTANQTFEYICEDDEEYDQAITARMGEILQKTALNSVLDNEIVSTLLNDTYLENKPKVFPDFRRTNLIEETPACTARESIIYPQRAKTINEDWAFVVNQDMVRQGVRVEKCITEGRDCNLGSAIPPTVQTVCRQKFIYRKLLVLSNDGNDIQPESVLIPSCCVCYIRTVKQFQVIAPRISNRTTPVSSNFTNTSRFPGVELQNSNIEAIDAKDLSSQNNVEP